jgi:profilin
MSAIAASFNDKSEPKGVISNGIKINGEKYMTIEASDDSLKAKKVRRQPMSPYILRLTPDHLLTPPQGKEGIVAYKTAQALLIAHHPADIQTPNAFNSVAELGEYLKKVGY